jgi:hypothetical protein
MARSVQGMRVVSEGRLAAGLPYLRLGQGAPLVMALGGTAEHANPASVERRISMSTAARFAGHFTSVSRQKFLGLFLLGSGYAGSFCCANRAVC